MDTINDSTVEENDELVARFVQTLMEKLGEEIIGIAVAHPSENLRAIFVLMNDLPQEKEKQVESYERRVHCLQEAWAPLQNFFQPAVMDIDSVWETWIIQAKFQELGALKSSHKLVDNGLSALIQWLDMHQNELLSANKPSLDDLKGFIVESLGRNIFTNVFGQSIYELMDKKKGELNEFVDKLRTQLPDELIGIVAYDEKVIEEKDDDEAKPVDSNTDPNQIPLLIVLSTVKKRLPEELPLVVEEINRRGKIIQSVVTETEITNNFQVIHRDAIWESCNKADYKFIKIIGTGKILFDSGLMERIRSVYAHKEAVINKFEKYILAYAIAGSVVRGEERSDSDTDVFVVIDDTDIKKMTRQELKDKLRVIIDGISQTQSLTANKKDNLNVQTYILTDYWEALRDGSPVIYTLLQDGIPLHDHTGIFLAWKQLLNENRIRPSKVFVTNLFNSGSDALKRSKQKLRESCMEDLYYAVMNPSQALLMQIGSSPTDPDETIVALERAFVQEGLLASEDIQPLKDLRNLRKKLEHETDADALGKEFDHFYVQAEQLIIKLEALRQNLIEKETMLQLGYARERATSLIVTLSRVGEMRKYEDIKEMICELTLSGAIPGSLQADLEELVCLPDETILAEWTIEQLDSYFQRGRRTLDALYAAKFGKTSDVL